MSKNWRQSRVFRTTALLATALQVVFPPLALANSQPQIVTDGRTATTLNIQGSTTDIRTSTVFGQTGLNSFSRFNVYGGNTVNLHLPDQTSALVNMVHNEQTVIDGILNSYKAQSIGGNIYFLNPHGVLVGSTGVLNVGSMTLATPTPDFMTRLLAGNQMVSAPHLAQVLDNDMPLSKSGVIDIRGRINSLSHAAISAGDVNISGIIETGTQAKISVETLVNMNGARAMVDLGEVSDAPSVSIQAESDVNISGRVAADGADNIDAGQISITAKDNIIAGLGADISASGRGDNSSGGDVYVMADGRSTLQAGARLSADGGSSGDGGFVEFSARKVVELAGGSLSASAQNGAMGDVLIDPEAIAISANILRNTSTNGGDNDTDAGLTWSAGSLTLQADDNITIGSGITISSRQVASPSSASDHRTGASTGASGDITLDAKRITLGDGSFVTAEGTNSFAGGTVTLDADDRDDASITLNNATIKGANVVLDADAVFTPGGAYDNPTADANAAININNGSSIVASDNVTITADATQNKPGYSGGVLVQFDARDAVASITIDNASVTAGDDLTVAGKAEINTDLSKEGWANLASLLPADVSVSVTTSQSNVALTGTTDLQATSGDVMVTSEAVTLSTTTATAQSVGVAFTGAISAIDNQATLVVEDDASISGTDVTLRSRTKTNVTTVADSSAAGISGSSGQIAVGVSIINDNTSTRVLDNASITATSDVDILAESELTAMTAARATQDDNFTETVTSKFDAGIDNTSELDVDFLGANLQETIKTNFNDMLQVVPDSFGEDGGSSFQLAGAVTFAEVTNNTETTITVNDPSTATEAPSITADTVDVKAKAVTQAQSVASGRTDNASFGGQAGIGIQIFESTLSSTIQGGDNANVLITADDLTVAAETISYSGDLDNQSRSGVYGISGVGAGGGDNGVGIAGAIAVGINEVNDTTAKIGDNTTLDLDEDLTIRAESDTEVKVIADGTDQAGLVSGNLFKALSSDNSSSGELDLSEGGTLGIGASIAVATHKNDVEAVFEGGANFTGSDDPDTMTIAAVQDSATEAEAKGAGAGSVSIVPLAAVTAARNTARASIETSSSAITTDSNISVTSTQTITSSAIADGTAQSNSDGNAAIGIAAGVTVALDSNKAEIKRDLNSSGGDITASANTYKAVNAGAKSSAKFSDEDESEDSASTPDNATNNSTEDASAAGSSVISGYTTDADDNATSYDFSSQMSADTDGASNNASIGAIDEPDDGVSGYDFAQSSDSDQQIGGDGEDSSSSKITIGAAMGVTYAESNAKAEIADGVTLNAGSGAVSVTSLSNSDFSADADASATDGDYNIGGGVGLNIVNNENIAEIGDNTTITAGDLTVRAGMLSKVKDDNTTDGTNTIYADAVAGASTGEFSLAGAVGLNVVVKNNTQAVINTGADIRSSGDVTIAAVSNNKYDSNAKAEVGEIKGLWGGIDKELKAIKNMKMFKSGGDLSLEDVKDDIEEDQDNATSADAESGGDGEGGVGIGAGIALNIIIAEKTQAILANNADLLGGNTGAVTVTASADSLTETNAFAGAKPNEAGGDDAKTSLDAAVSVGILLKEVDAYVGTGSTINASDNISIITASDTKTISTAKGEVTASETAVGASVAVGVALENIDSRLERDLTTTGGFNLTASSTSQDIALADAVAAGAVVDKYASKVGKTKEQLTQSSNQISDVNHKPTSMEALNGGFSGGDGASFDTTGSDTATGENSGGEAQQSGSINIAASVAVNWSEHAVRATTADNLTISVGDDAMVRASNDANYRTRGSGMSVFADKSIAVGVGLLKTGQVTKAKIGDGVTLTNTESSGDVTVLASTSENQGTDGDGNSFRSYASSEGIAGAGGGELGVAGALSLVVSTDTQEAVVGEGASITAPGDITVKSTATNKIVNRAWAIAIASDYTCSDPGNCGGQGGDKTAVGASIAVNVVVDNNKAEVGENASIDAGDNATVLAEDLSSAAGDFTLDPEDNTTSTQDYLTTNYLSVLQDSSYYAEAMAGGVAQGGNAGTGSLAVTVSVGSTKAVIGEGANITADDVTVKAYNESDAKHLVGAVAISTDKKAVGASISGVYLREDVMAIIGDDGSADDNATTRLIANTGDVDIDAEADQESMTFMAAGGVSGNDLALAGAFGFNVLDSDVEARIVEDAVIQATQGNIGLDATHSADIRNFALAVSGSGGGNSVGGSLALNLFLADKKAIAGSSATGNNISMNAGGSVNVGVDARQEITNGVISASVSTSSNAISGALSVNIMKGDSYALVREGADINDNTTINSASSTQAVDVTVSDNSTIFDFTGTLAASSSTSVGIALGANVFWKDVKASVASTINADQNVRVVADTKQSLTSFVVGIAASTGGATGAGSVGVGLIKSTTFAEIAGTADIQTSGSVQLHAGDDTDIFMMEPAASFSGGGSSLAGAVGAAVFVGQTKAKIKNGASVTALGNSVVQVETEETRTSSPLLDGIVGGDDNETREALGDFNDDFTFENVKDLFLTERRITEDRRGVAVSAVADQDVISIAASGAVSSSAAIAVSLSAGVGVGQVEASIGDADINAGSGSPNADQDVLVRALSDTYWTDVSGAIAVGTGSAGVGIGGDIVVQVKDTRAFIGTGANVTAANDVIVHARNTDRIINSALSVGGGSTAGVSGAAAIGVVVNTTKAYIDGAVDAGSDLTVKADAHSEHIQIAGGIGAGGTAGIGASFGIGFMKNETEAYIDENAVTNASDNTSVNADSTENAVTAVIAGGVGGTVGVSVSAGIKVHMSNTRAYIKGQVNQDDNYSSSTQDVYVSAINRINTVDVVGGVGGGGTVGVGVTLNALVVYNNAQAWIGGGSNTRVSAERDISVKAKSSKSTKNFLLAGAAGGTVAVGGNIAVLLVGAQADDEVAGQMDSEDHGDIAGESDDRTQSVQLGDTISPDNSSGDYNRTGFDFAELTSAIDDNNSAHGQIGSTFNAQDSGLSRNKTQAFIENGAVVRANNDLTLDAEDTTNTVFVAAAISGAGTVAVGATVGVLLVNNTAEAYIGRNAIVNVENDILIRSRTSEVVGSGALSAGGSGVASVQGTIMAQATKSKSRAFIQDNAVVNDNTSENADQSVALMAESDTDLVSIAGSGGGALVGVGITGDVMILEKETKAYIGDNATVRSGGDISVDAKAQADLIQVALSINGGFVGVTGAAGIAVANNTTQARIGENAVVYANDSIRLEATDDTEIDAVVITGAGGAVGVSGSVGVYVAKSTTEAKIEDNASVTAMASGDGITALSGTIDNSSVEIVTKTTRDQEGNEETSEFEQVNATFDNENKYGLQVAAVTYEDLNFAPVGVAGGVVGVAGVIATTVANSTTRAIIEDNANINTTLDNSGAGANQSVELLAKSRSQLNNISSGIGVGAVGVTFDIDTQVFNKTVEAKMLGDARAKRNITVEANSKNNVYQTAVTIAGGAVGVGGIVMVSVVNDTVTSEIGDNSTVVAGEDLTVNATSDLNVYQTAGNVAAGGVGVGASIGILVAKSTTTAGIGDGSNVHVEDNLTVIASSNTNMHQNIMGFAGGGVSVTGSLGINVLKNTTLAKIGSNVQINQMDEDNRSTQSVNVIANENLVTQGAAGAAAVGAAAGVGMGLTLTALRANTQAIIGANSVVSARDDVTVEASSVKNINNSAISFGGGGGVGASGSVALTIVGGEMSGDAGSYLEDDNGSMVAAAETDATQDRNVGDGETHDGRDTSGKSNQLYADQYDAEASNLAETQTSGIQSDVEGSDNQSTLALIGNNAVISAGDDLTLRASDNTTLGTNAGGGGTGGAAGVGVTMGMMFNNAVTEARVGTGVEINATEATLIEAKSIETVNKFGMTGGGGGVSVQATAMVNVSKTITKASIGANSQVNQDDNSSNTQSVALKASSESEMIAVSGSGGGGAVGAGVSGDAMVLEKQTIATIDDGAVVSSQGDLTIDAEAKADLLQLALSVNGGIVGVTGAAGIAVVKNHTKAAINDNAVVYVRDSMRLHAQDDTEIDAVAIAGAVGAVAGASGAVGVYVVKSTTESLVGEDTEITALGAGDGVTSYSGNVDNSSTRLVTKTRVEQDGTEIEDNYTVVDANFETGTQHGLTMSAVTNEDITFAPIGAAGGGTAGLSGVIATTVVNSTTKTQIGNGSTINQANTGAGSAQDVTLTAASNTQLNNISAAIGIGSLGAAFDLDTQVYKKTVEARVLGNVTAKRDVQIKAETNDRVLQTSASAAGGIAAAGGLAAVSVISNSVKAEIGDNSTTLAGDDVDVLANQNVTMVQTAGNVAAGGVAAGASIGVLYAKTENTARIGNAAQVTAGDNITVAATTDIDMNQNVIGGSGGLLAAISGSIGFNLMSNTTLAEIGDGAKINQASGYDNLTGTQRLNVVATEDISSQGAAGAAAIGGVAGVGIGVALTVNRGSVKARIGNNTLINAEDDIVVSADAIKSISNQGIAFSGGLGLGAAGSVAVTLIGGAMSDNASDAFSNDSGSMTAEADENVSKDRQANDGEDETGKTRLSSFTGEDDNETNTLVMNETSGLQNFVEGTDTSSTLAEIGSNAVINSSGEVTVEATETLELSQISGGAAIGAVGVGGFVAVADYAGSVTARIGNNTRIDNTTGVTVDATIQSGDGISIDLPDNETVGVEGVHSVVVGASVGLVGLAASIAQVNLEENARAEIGDNVTINTASNSADITVSSDRDIDAEVLVAAVAGGIAAAGISVVDINTSGDSLALVGANSTFGTSDSKTGDVLITARNDSSHSAKAVSAGLGYLGAVVGAFVNITDEGETKSSVGSNTAIYSNRTVQITSYENTSNDVDAVGVAVAAGVGISGVFTDVDVTRDSEVELYDNVTITGDDVTIVANAGDGSIEAANNYTVAAAGGALIGANATVSDTDVDIDTSINIGTNSTITDAGSTSITTYNRTRSKSRTTGFSVGLAAVGANFSYLDDTSDSQINVGAGVTIASDEYLTVQAQSAKNAQTDTIAGAGGAIAATGGEARTTNTAVTRVAFANSTSSNRSSLTAGDNATIKALNEDQYDHAIDASNVGGVSVSAGVGISNGTSDLDVTLGDYLDLTGQTVFVNASNKMAKKGVSSPNFAVRGGGAIAVALGESRGTLTQNTDVTIGEFSSITGTGTNDDRSLTQITAFSGLEIDDEAETNVGGAISVPRADASQIGIANTTIRFEDNASITTTRGDVIIETQSAPLVDVRAFTSTYGLVGAGAEARAVANITKTDRVIFENNATTEVDGMMDVYAGRLATAFYHEHTIDTESRIWNNTAIPIDTGRQSDITFTNNATIDIQSGAALKSTRDIKLMATRLQAAETLGLDREYLLVKSYGEAKNLYQAAGEAITGGNYSDFYGSETTSGSAGVNVDGTVETGIKKDVSVTINAAMSNYYVDDNGTTQRYTIQFDNASENPSNKWVLIDQRIVDQNIIHEENGDNDSRVSPIVGYLDDNITVENASWTIDPEVDFASNVRAEIAALNEVLNAYPEGSTSIDEDVDNGSETQTVTTSSSYSTDQLDEMRSDVESRIAVLESSIALYGSEPVPVVKISDIEAATGNVKIVSDYVAGGGTINAPSGESITITNNSPIALVVNDIEIPDLGGGNIIFNGVTVTTGNEINTINGDNLPSGESQSLTLVSGEGSGDPTVTINNNFDATNVAYNPNNISDITAPAIALRTESEDGYGGIRNIRGTVTVNNETGSIFSQASVAAKTVEISSGGNYVFDADVNVFHVGGDPRNNTAFSAPTSASHSDTINDYNSGNGDNTIAEMDDRAFNGDCDPLRKELTGSTLKPGVTFLQYWMAIVGGQSTANMVEPTFTDHPSTCHGTFNTATNTNSSSVIAASNDVFISANNLNINGLIQAGITNKSITVSQSEVDTALSANPTADVVTVKSVNKTLEGSIVGNTDNRYVSGDIKVKYDREKDELFVTTADVKGGNLTVAGRIISTGKGKLVAADGYGQISVTNNSNKKLSLSNLSTGGMEGKITIVDSLKDNGLGSSLITEYTRNAGTLTVTNNLNSSSIDNVVSNPQYNYNPESGARFNFMSGQQTVDRETEYRSKTTKRLWGVDLFDVGNDFWSGQAVDRTETDTLSGDQLPEGDYVIVDTADTSEYTFRADQIETERTLVLDESGTDRCWWGGFLNMVRYCRYYNNTAYVVGSLRYNYHSLAADKQIAIGFSGDEDGGSINVTSAGGIVVSGQIENANGTTSITASGGDILNESETDSISTGNLTLAATTGSIGTSDNPIRINQTESDNLTITAGQNVNVASPAGSLYINSINVGGSGAIRLKAKQNVQLKGNGVLTGHTIDIVAEEGTATSGDGVFRVNTDADNDGTLTILAGGGNINVEETDGDLRVKQLVTSDNITITVVDGNLLDGNSEQVDDEVAISDLNALVDQMGLTGTAAQEKKKNTVETYEGQVETLYNDYFRLRNVGTNSDNETTWDVYDPNFTYTATASERSAMSDNATRISQFEASQQTTYQSGFEKFGDPETYDDNFSYTATEEEVASITNGFEWTDDQLNNKIPVIEFKEVADTTLAIESTNVSGNTITINVDNGSVGQLTHNFTVDLFSEGNADHDIDDLDNTTRLAMAAAESEDATYDNETGVMTISMYEDFDVKATGNVNVSAQDVIYLGSESNTLIERADAGGDVRIKMDGNMLNGRSDNATVVSGANILLESGKGRIGASDKRFIVDVDNGSTLSGRSRDGIYIGEATDDINVGSFYSLAAIDLLSPGGIYDNALDMITDIKGQDVTLTAENAIGQEPADGDSDAVKKNKALDVATINDDNSTFTITSNTDGAWLYTDFGQPMRLTGADLDGDLDMAVASGLKVVGSLDTNGGTVTLRSFESLNLEGIGGVDTNGAVLNLSSGDNMQLSGTISTGGGDIMATVGDNFTTAENTSLSTSGGNLEIDADALADSLGYQNVTIGDGSVIDLDNGTLLIESSDTVTLTGVVTTNNSDDAVVIRATSIQDGGDSNADITMNGNGDITLKTHSYANLNRIDYNGSQALNISVNGKNDGARAVGTMLGIEAEAGINVTNLSVNSGAIQSPTDSVFNVINGRIRDSLFITIDGFDARVGRLPDNMLEPDRWLSAGASPGFFDNGALSSGVRDEDYRCTGLPSFITDANAVLDFNFSYDNPVVNCSGVLTYYRLPFVLSSPVETSEQVLDSQLAGLISTSLINLRTVNQQDLIDQSVQIFETPNVARDALKSERKQTEAIQQAQASSDEFIGGFRTRSQGLFGAINIGGEGFIVPVAIDQNLDDTVPEEDQAQEETTPPLANNNGVNDDTLNDDEANNAATEPANDNNDDLTIGPLSLLNN